MGQYDDIPVEAQIELDKWAREQLNRVDLEYFNGEPLTIQPSGEATLTWKVTTPDIGIQIKINDSIVETQGSKTIRPNHTTVYRLKAQFMGIERQLALIIITVDLGDCVEIGILDSTTEDKLQEVVEGMLGDDQLIIRNNISVGTDPTGMKIHIPLLIKVDKWFDADLDIDLKADIKESNGRVVVKILEFTVDVSWSFLEHLTSLFCTALLQAVLDTFLTTMLLQPVRDGLANGFQAFVDQYIASTNNTHRLFTIREEMYLVNFAFCPVNPAGIKKVKPKNP